jgi:hypothetical protein
VETLRGFSGSGRDSLSNSSTYSTRALLNAEVSRYDQSVPSIRVVVPTVASYPAGVAAHLLKSPTMRGVAPLTSWTGRMSRDCCSTSGVPPRAVM